MTIKIKSGYNFREVNPRDVLFLDVETVPLYSDFEALPQHFQELWREKSRKYSYENRPAEELYFEKAGIHAEFGKIVCISVGNYKSDRETNKMNLRIKSFYGNDEKQILTDFRELL